MYLLIPSIQLKVWSSILICGKFYMLSKFNCLPCIIFCRILYHFHKNSATHVRAKVSPPRLNGIKTGVFATRSPHRPSPIGLSLVKIDRIIQNTIYFSGVDMVNQTPVLDIKPYIPQYDNPECLNMQNANLKSQYVVPICDVLDEDLDDSYDSMDVRTMDGEENSGRNSAVGDRNRRSENLQSGQASRCPE